MWKWILGTIAVIVIGLATTCYIGLKKVTGGGDSAQVTIKGRPERVFALLTDRDSVLAWRTGVTDITPVLKRAFQSGDTIRITSALGSDSARTRTQLWVVREVHAPALIVLDAVQFNSAGVPHVVNTRRDSLVAAGDSTRVIATLSMSPTFLSAQTGGEPRGGAQAIGGLAEKLMLGTARMMAESELQQLKRYVERR
jgi:hypothetical protein